MTPSINPIEIMVCADDYAQNQSISEGIVHLAEQGRINAISCMVNSTCWNDSHAALYAQRSDHYVGLHFNLTHGNAMSSLWKDTYGIKLPGMAWLLQQACLRRLKSHVVIAEIKAQLDAYTHTMNAWPDFIDGHQHVHQLPIIRDALLSVCADSSHPNLFIRKTSNGWLDLLSTDGMPKRQLIALLGGIALQKHLVKQAVPSNTSFSGIYNFKEASHYRVFFKRFLKQTRDGGLIMCHPGKQSEDRSDPLYLYRHHEFNYFMSDDYLSDLARYSCQLKRKEV